MDLASVESVLRLSQLERAGTSARPLEHLRTHLYFPGTDGIIVGNSPAANVGVHTSTCGKREQCRFSPFKWLLSVLVLLHS